MNDPHLPLNGGTDDDIRRWVGELVDERDSALISMDKDTIIAYAQKYRVPMGNTNDETRFWLIVHVSRVQAMTIPRWARRESAEWLRQRGYVVRP